MAAKQDFEKALGEAIVNIQALKRENKSLLDILQVNTILSTSLRLDLVLDLLMEKAKKLCSAQASSLMLVDEEKQELYFHIIKDAQAMSLRKVRLKMGEGIAGWVAQEKKAVLVRDCTKDKRFSSKGDEQSSFQTRTMMCVPLIYKDRVLGTIQVLNRKDKESFDNSNLRLFQIMANQAAIAIENAHLHELATVDAMTGLYMKNYFLARLRQEYKRAKHQKYPLSLLMLDIDYFKKVNDNYGHQGGDRALVYLAKIVQETLFSLKKEDMAGRYGGEEFCALLPMRDKKEACDIAEQIRQNVEHTPIPIDLQHTAHISVSIGIANFPSHKRALHKAEDLISCADEALYVCKGKGRNCVAFYGEKA